MESSELCSSRKSGGVGGEKKWGLVGLTVLPGKGSRAIVRKRASYTNVHGGGVLSMSLLSGIEH